MIPLFLNFSKGCERPTKLAFFQKVGEKCKIHQGGIESGPPVWKSGIVAITHKTTKI